MAHEAVGFLDETIKGKEFGDKPDMFKVEFGRKDIIRILTTPVRHWVHSIPFRKQDGTETVFWLNCAASDEAVKGDDVDTMAQECPACKAGYECKERFVMMVLWLVSEKAGRPTKRMQILPWSIPGSKYVNIRELATTLPKGTTMMQQDIRLIGEDTNWQKCTMMLNNTKTVIPADVKKEIVESQLVPGGKAGEYMDWRTIKDLLEVESNKDMVAALRRALPPCVAGGGTDPLESGNANAPRGNQAEDPLAALAAGDNGNASPNDDAPAGDADAGAVGELDALLGDLD